MSWSPAESLHRAIRAERASPKSAAQVAREIEDAMFSSRAQCGTVLGSQSAMASRFGVGRAVIREAIRILEARGSVRTSRGSRGGVVVAHPDLVATVRDAVQFFQLNGVERERVHEARRELDYVRAGLRSGRFGIAPATAASDTALGLFERIIDSLAFAAPIDSATLARSRAESIAHELASTVRREQLAAGSRLTDESEISERFNVSRLVARQAARILETAGIVTSERGRGRGLIVSTPGPAVLIGLTHVYFAAHEVTAPQARGLLRGLNTANARLAALHLTVDARRSIEQLRARLTHCGRDDTLAWLEAPQLISRIAGNACIDAFARCLVAFVARAHPETSVMSQGLTREVALLFADVLGAIATGDPARAEAVQIHMQQRVAALAAERTTKL